MKRTLRNLGGLVVPGRFRFHEPDETRTFSSLRELVDFVAEYRKANAIPVGSREALRAEIEDWLCHKIGSPEQYCFEDGRPMARRDHTNSEVRGNGYQGQAKWRALHEWALTSTPSSPRREWMEDFTGSLPCGDCRREWRRMLRESPPPLSGTPGELWLWTFDRHNDVRRRIGQKEWEIAAAYSEVKPAPEGFRWNPEYLRAAGRDVHFPELAEIAQQQPE